MLSIVIQSWKISLSIFLPQRIKNGISSVIKNLFNTIKNTISILRWFLILDVFFTFVVAEALAKKITSGSGFTFLYTLMELNWFIIYSSMIIFIRKQNNLIDAKTYLKSMFFKYVNVLFIFSVLFFLLLWFMLAFNITKFPSFHWSFATSFQILELLVIFYWLDSNFKLFDFFSSLEKAVNLIFYNLPVFIIFFALLLGLDFLLKLIFSGTLRTNSPILLSEKLIESVKSANHFSQFKFIFIKYSKILFEIFWICILFAFYNKNRNEYYNENIFEYKENENN